MAQPTLGADEGQHEQIEPWYSATTNDYPFKLFRQFSQGKSNAPAFRSLSFFPWEKDSLEDLWNGSLQNSEIQSPWEEIVNQYWDAVAVTSDCSLHIFFTHQKRPTLTVELPPAEEGPKLLDADKMCVAWAISLDEPLQPLVVFSRGSLLYTFNVIRSGIMGYVRGHGGAITSIAVHPTNVHLICTTSRDYTTRVYDLRLDVVIEVPRARAAARRHADFKAANPNWFPEMKPSLAGAAHGLRLPDSEREGSGKGRCVCVLMGGRAGGHTAAVLAAAFNPNFSLIATCGMDRTVKIWPFRPDSETNIKREDKPFFSSSMIHRGRVMSISWLEDDLLISHSAPAVMRVDPDNPRRTQTYVEAGELTIWRWLGLDRFFPADQELKPPTALLGVGADYQESSSFRIIATHRFPDVPTPLLAPSLSLYSAQEHDPLLLINYPNGVDMTLVNAMHMVNRTLQRAVAEPDDEAETAVEAPHASNPADTRLRDRAPTGDQAAHTEDTDEEENTTARFANHRTSGRDEELDNNDLDDAGPPASDDEDEEGEEIVLKRSTGPPPPMVRGWVLQIPERQERRVMASAMGHHGQVVAAVGTSGTLWVWQSGQVGGDM